MSTHIETIIIGGGQAGLAVSYYLSRQDRPHIVLEQAAEVGRLGAIIAGTLSPSILRIGNPGYPERTFREKIQMAFSRATKLLRISKATWIRSISRYATVYTSI